VAHKSSAFDARKTGASRAAFSVCGLVRVVSWRVVSRMTTRCMVLVKLLGAVLTLEFMTFAGNGEQGGGREQDG
jgi:hypothetical protein